MSEVERLNNDEYFMANWDYELDEIRLRNTEIDCAKEEGISEGEHSKEIETARNKLKDNIKIENIAKYTNLSKEDIIKQRIIISFLIAFIYTSITLVFKILSNFYSKQNVRKNNSKFMLKVKDKTKII